jgi:hypothetical protein
MKTEIALSFAKAFFQSKTGQLISGLVVSLGIGFFGGRASVEIPQMPPKEKYCLEYIEDRDQVKEQLVKCQQGKIDSDKSLIKELTEKLNAACDKRVQDATSDAKFSPRIHCQICKSRGHCK